MRAINILHGHSRRGHIQPVEEQAYIAGVVQWRAAVRVTAFEPRFEACDFG